MDEMGYTVDERKEIKKDVRHYENVHSEIKLASGDYIDLKAYEPAMRHLIDRYISAEESESISAFDDTTLIYLIVKEGPGGIADKLPRRIGSNKEAMAEAIVNNIRRLITDETSTNPKYFEKMSVLLDELIEEQKKATKDYAQYLAKLAELSKRVRNTEDSESYPDSLDTKAKRSLYDNLEKDEKLAGELHTVISNTRKADWRGNIMKERQIKNANKNHLHDEKDVDRIFELIFNQDEY